MRESASTKNSCTLALLKPSAGVHISSSTALLSSIAILITIEYISKIGTQNTKLRDWNKVKTLLFEKTLKQSMFDKKNKTKRSWGYKKDLWSIFG